MKKEWTTPSLERLDLQQTMGGILPSSPESFSTPTPGGVQFGQDPDPTPSPGVS